MLKRKTDQLTQPKPLRLWPGLIAAILLFLVKFVLPFFIQDALPITMMGGPLIGLLIIVWWLFFSRAPHVERWGGFLLMIIALFATRPLLHESIAKGGLGMLYPILALPILCLALVVWAVISRHFSTNIRRLTMIVTILLAASWWTLIRTAGINPEGHSDFAWRWTQTPEERLLAEDESITAAPVAAAETDAQWPGFRGAHRDGIAHGTSISADWSATPPVEIWRRPVGPGWSSFAVGGNLFYTQEQRGGDEVVSCYDLNTGEPIWQHRDNVRFWESNSGPGPRATPTLSGGRVYTFGATGILNVLDSADGSVIWSRNAATDTETKTPIWGFASSPLVADDLVIVAPAGSLIAYDLATGESRWSFSAGGDCYSSPHLMTICGVKQIVLQNVSGAVSVSLPDGKKLWQHDWPGNPIVQPMQTADGDILLSVDDRSGIRLITVAPESDGWSHKERWTSDRVIPYFNDSVIHREYIYGFDGPSLACVDVDNGERQWKGGRYGRGQLMLLADQDVLLVVSEKGELVLVKAIAEQFTEIARFVAISGKTWNHPALAGDILLVRNGQEMAAFRLSPIGA